jgi:hypothetical protein
MSRSQRHKVIIQGTDSAGKGLSEKQPAIVYIQQFAASQAFAVPIGPSGGPLQGSSVAGFPPTLIPPPTGLMRADAELTAEGGFSDPGQFNLSGNPIHQDLPPAEGGELPPPDGGGGTDPEPGMEPTLTSLDPDTAELGSADITLRVLGTNFTDSSVIHFSDNDEPTTFVSDTEVTTGVKPSLGWGAVSLPVTVKQGSYETDPLDFTFTEPVEAPTPVDERLLPDHPILISAVERIGDGIGLTLNEDVDVRPGDYVLIEATGNTQVNGSYAVLQVNGRQVVVANMVDLSAPIEGKGRVTIQRG